MNHTYRLVRNRSTGLTIAVAEIATSASACVSTGRTVVLALAAIGSLMSLANAAPTGGTVTSGTATITNAGADTTINQSSQSTIINWQSFDIAAHERVQFVQPNATSVALNRVLGADATQIMGNLSANGKVFLINPNGVLFGKSAHIDVGGLVASTRSITDEDFLAGRYRFTGTSDAGVTNQGAISSEGGYVALLGAQVSNQGLISARLGSIALASGNAFTLSVGDGLFNVTVDEGAIRSLTENGGILQADGGQVLMTARSANSLVQSVVNNTGVVQAQTIENRGGVIRLLGDMQSGVANVDGKLDASAPNGGDGGFIDTSAAHVSIAPTAQVTTLASSGKTGEWLIDPVDFTIAASGGDITGAQLSTNLGSSNVTIQSSSGASGVNGDIHVNDTVTWSANQLTLNAYRDINVNRTMNASGTASLAIEYGQGAVAAGNTAQFNVRAPVNLPAGNSLSIKLGSDGTTNNYTVITSRGAANSTTGTDLQGINGALSGYLALGADINASGISFIPIGTSGTPFTGVFNGLAHTISNLNITFNNDNAGLFGVNGAAGLITNVRMSNSYVYYFVRSNGGSLVGFNYGTVTNSYTSGFTVQGGRNAGGLVGRNQGTIRYGAAASGNTYATFYAGGLVGFMDSVSALVSNSYSAGTYSGTNIHHGGFIGGMDSGTIENAYTTGTASGSNNGYIGGFIGTFGGGTITNSFYNSSLMSQGNGSLFPASGFTGLSTSALKNQASFTPAGSGAGQWDFTNVWVIYEGQTTPLLRAFLTPITVTANNATKTYDGAGYTGSAGVTYSTTPNMSNVLGTLSYTGGTNVGSYAITPSGLYSNQLGYLITYAPGTLTVNPYGITVTGNRTYDGTTTVNAGMLSLGSLPNGETLALSGSGSVVSKDVGNGKTLTLGSLALGNGTGLASNYTLSGGSFNITPKVLSAVASATNKVYDGTTTASATLGSFVGLVGSETIGATATATFNTKDVATANLVTVNSVLLSNGTNGGLASNYTLASGQTASASITPKALSATASASNKVYDGTTSASATLGSITGLIGSETLGAAATATFNSKDVATANLVTVNSVLLSNGTNGGLASNYSLASGQTASASITPKALTATASASNKVYDGNASAIATLGSITGLVGSETVGTTASATFNSKDVATANLVTVTGVVLSNGTNGGLASNYSLAGGQTANASITPKTLTATASAANKVYDGNTTANVTLGSISGLIGNETIGANVVGVFNSKDVATANTVTIGSVTLIDGANGGLASNYSLASGQSAAAHITPKALTVSGQSALDKIYDGTTAATLTHGSLAGVIGGDNVSIISTGTFSNASVGQNIPVTVSNILGGGDAANYTLVPAPDLSANIRSAAGAVSLPDGVDRFAAYEGARGSVATSSTNISAAAAANSASDTQIAPSQSSTGASSSPNSASDTQVVSSQSSAGASSSTNGAPVRAAGTSVQHIDGLNLTIMDFGLKQPEWNSDDQDRKRQQSN